MDFVKDTNNSKTLINKRIFEYLIEEINKSNSKIEKKDIIIIGLGNIKSEYTRLKNKIENKEDLIKKNS